LDEAESPGSCCAAHSIQRRRCWQ